MFRDFRYGGKRESGRGEKKRKKNSDLGRLLVVRNGVAKIVKGENWYGVKQISGESLLRHLGKGKKKRKCRYD